MILAPVILVSLALAQPAPTPAKADNPADAITRIRTELVEAFNKGDVDAMAKHFDPDVVAVWQDGTVCHGPAEIKAYYQRLMGGPDKLITKAHTNPQVDGRHLYGDVAVSYGRFNDSYDLTNGASLTLDSKFTSTLAKRDGEWKVVAFHASGDMFKNDIITMVVKKTALWVGIGAGLVGLLVGVVTGRVTARRKQPGATV
jgi:uncharacterized protein (TIGR02246 family)